MRCDIAVWLSKLSVTSMWSMFYGASSFNSDVSNFDTSRVTDMGYRVTDMEYMFYGAKSFNQDLSNFDTSSVFVMAHMFSDAISFDGDVSNFDTNSGITHINGILKIYFNAKNVKNTR